MSSRDDADARAMGFRSHEEVVEYQQAARAEPSKEPFWFAIEKETLRLVEVSKGTPGAYAFDMRSDGVPIERLASRQNNTHSESSTGSGGTPAVVPKSTEKPPAAAVMVEVSMPSDEEIEAELAKLPDDQRESVQACVDELLDMAEQYGDDVLMVSTMVVAARLSGEAERLN